MCICDTADSGVETSVVEGTRKFPRSSPMSAEERCESLS
jgi:hypothetical protein